MLKRNIWNAFGYGTLLEDGRRYGPKKTQDSFGKDSENICSTKLGNAEKMEKMMLICYGNWWVKIKSQRLGECFTKTQMDALSRLKMDQWCWNLHKITYNDNITIIYTKISVMKNFYLLKIGKSQTIHKMLYKSTRCTQTSEHKAGKKTTSIPMLGSCFQPPASFFLEMLRVSLVRKGSWS